MKKKDWINEREYQLCLESTSYTQLQQLKSLKTATKKRRALKKMAARNSSCTKSTTTASS